jgi:hypothetical protein
LVDAIGCDSSITIDFTIDFNEVYSNISITITGISERVISSTECDQNQLLNSSIDEPTGVYLLMVVAGQERAVIGLVKE